MNNNHDASLPVVTNRKYYRHEAIGSKFFLEMGWKIQKHYFYSYKELTVNRPTLLEHRTYRDHFVLIEGQWIYSCTVIDKTREWKHLCIGGPLAGQFLAASQTTGYIIFDPRGSYGLKSVLIHTEILKK